jgi:hypothetical protein
MKTFSIFWKILAPFEHFMVNFCKSYPFKDARAGYVYMFWLIWFSTHLVDAEWDSPSTESMRSETPRQLSQSRVRLHVNWVNKEGTNIYDFIIPCWLSWCWVSLRIGSVSVESHLALTPLTGNETPRQLSHHWVFTIWISRRIQEPNRKHWKALLFGLYMFD